MKLIIFSLCFCLYSLVACNAQRVSSLKNILQRKTKAQLNVKPYASFSSLNGGHNSPVQTIAVLTNGLVATGSLDNTVKIWDMEKKTLLYTLDKSKNGHSDWVFLGIFFDEFFKIFYSISVILGLQFVSFTKWVLSECFMG